MSKIQIRTGLEEIKKRSATLVCAFLPWPELPSQTVRRHCLL